MKYLTLALAVVAAYSTCRCAAAQAPTTPSDVSGPQNEVPIIPFSINMAAAMPAAPIMIAQQAPSMFVASQSATTPAPDPTDSAAYTGWVPPYLRGQSNLRTEVYAGIRYDSDANQAVDASILGQTGQTLTPATLQKESDWSFVSRASVNHEYALPGSRGIVWETNVDIADQRFFSISHNYDLTVVQADTGPRWPVGKIGEATASLRPFGSYAWIGYGEHTYASLYGGGMAADLRAARWNIRLTGIGRFGNYEDSSFRPLTRPYTGPEWLISLSSTVLIGSATTFLPAFSWYQTNGRSNDFSRAGPTGSLSLERDILLRDRVTEWVMRGSVQRLVYGGPPDQSQALAARDDTQWTGNLSFTIPVFRSALAVGLRSIKTVFEYQYLRNDSNYFPFRDHEFTIGIKASL